jgi:hypothetical protein
MEMPLLGRGRDRGKSFAPLRGFWLWLRLGRLLDFFSAFVFASHICQCATKGEQVGRTKLLDENRSTPLKAFVEAAEKMLGWRCDKNHGLAQE